MRLKNFKFDWERFPALYLFLSLLSGGFLFKGVFSPLIFFLTHKKKSFQLGFLFLSFFTCYLFSFFKHTQPLSLEYVKVHLNHLELKQIENRIYLRAFVPYAVSEKNQYRNFSVLMNVSERETFDTNFLCEGKLLKNDYGYFFSPYKKISTGKKLLLIQTRFKLKQKIRNKIFQFVDDPECQEYFSALLTGQISSRFLKMRFLANGLLHTLAISGFHFSWIIFLCSIPLSLFLSRKTTLVFLLFLAWFYFLFLGNTSSVSRAWIAVTIYLLSLIFSKVPLALNALGIAGLCSIFTDPYSIFNVGFGLSFLATFTLITLSSRMQTWANIFCKKRNPLSLKLMPWFEQLIYFILRFFSVGFFLSCIITFSLLPIFIQSFSFISLSGIFYNLFFPISIIPTLIFLIVGFFCPLFFKFAEIFTKPFLFSVLFGSGMYSVKITLTPLSPHLVGVWGTLFLLFCFFEEKKSFNEFLITQDEMLLT